MVEFNLYNLVFDLSFLKQTFDVELVIIICVCSSSALVVSAKCEMRVVMAKAKHCTFLIPSTTDKSV